MKTLEATYQMHLDKRDTALVLAALQNSESDAWAAGDDAYATTVGELRGRIIGTSIRHYRSVEG